ncbi:hypothetical protein C8R45DRAFT_1211946 [Mycena sanguinolenta]|nr:hypothetical protein C8R45DRAFT_1211946 [Mycena sanguinolenta]
MPVGDFPDHGDNKGAVNDGGNQQDKANGNTAQTQPYCRDHRYWSPLKRANGLGAQPNFTKSLFKFKSIYILIHYNDVDVDCEFRISHTKVVFSNVEPNI